MKQRKKIKSTIARTRREASAQMGNKTTITIRLDPKVIAWAKKQASEADEGYQTWINEILTKLMLETIDVPSPGKNQKLLEELLERVSALEKEIKSKPNGNGNGNGKSKK